MKLIRKIQMGVLFSAVMAGLPAIAQDNVSDNIYKERRDLIKRTPNIDNTLSVGWFVGAADSFEFRDILFRYMPLSNLLSSRTGELTVIMTDKLAEKVADEALLGNLDIVYTSIIEGSRLVAKGWRPLVGRTEDLVGTIIMRTDVANPESLEGKKIIGVDGGVTTSYVKYALSKSGVLPKVLFLEQATSQNDLMQILRKKQIDGVVVRDGFADRFVKQNPGYKIAFKAPPAKGHTIFVSPLASLSSVEAIRKTMLELSPDNNFGKKILSGLDGYSATDKTPFSDRSGADFKIVAEVREVLAKLPKFDKFNVSADGGVSMGVVSLTAPATSAPATPAKAGNPAPTK